MTSILLYILDIFVYYVGVLYITFSAFLHV